MPLTDMSLDHCLSYTPALEIPGDLHHFWSASVAEAEAEAAAQPTRFEPVRTGMGLVDTYDVTFSGFGGAAVRGWLHIPAKASDPLPCVVQFQGYGEGRGRPWDDVFWAVAGFAHFVMDTRGQGWGRLCGDTPDPVAHGTGEPSPVTWGLDSPDGYYYRRVYVDAVRACAACAEHPAVDSGRLVVSGASQGGAVATAAAALVPTVRAALVDVPFMSDIARAVDICGVAPYADVAAVLRHRPERSAAALRTLSYFDAAALAGLATAPALLSVAMMDEVCPPSTGFAVYRRYGGPKALHVYRYGDHGGGESAQRGEQLQWLSSLLDRARSDVPVDAQTVGGIHIH